VDLLYPCDWPTILADGGSSDDHDMALFFALRRWPVLLLQEDHNNPKAKEVLKKLGSCDALIIRFLRRTVAGKFSSTAGACMALDDLDD
jgi:hypothetical protein